MQIQLILQALRKKVTEKENQQKQRTTLYTRNTTGNSKTIIACL